MVQRIVLVSDPPAVDGGGLTLTLGPEIITRSAVYLTTEDYLEASDALTYFGTRSDAIAFTGAETADQSNAIRMASQAINCLVLKGRKCDPESQPNAFPRYIPLARGGWVGDGSTVPNAVIEACAEEALEIMKNGSSKRLTLQNQGVTSFTIDNLSETFETRSEFPRLTSERARLLMYPYLAKGVPIV